MNKISPGTILGKTAIFILLNILLNVGCLIVSLLALTLVFKISGGAEKFNWLGALIWLVVTVIIHFAVNYLVGYMVKAGHISVMVDSVQMQAVPDNPLKTGIDEVKEKYPTCNMYFAQRSALRAAIDQIQRKLNVVGKRFKEYPVLSQMTDVASFFVGLALSFVANCCVGYYFKEENKGIYKCSAESVLIYHQGWRRMIEGAVSAAGKIILAVALSFFFVTSIFAAVFTGAFDGNAIAGLMGAMALAYCVSSSIKNGIIDSYLTADLMDEFLKEAEFTDFSVEAYSSLYSESTKFAALYNKAKREEVESVGMVQNQMPANKQ